MYNLLCALCGLVALWCLLILSADSYRRRIAVLEALIGGPRLGREIPLGIGARYVVLIRMEVDGLVESWPEYQAYGDEWPTGRRYYITDAGRRMVGDHDR